MVIIQVLCTAIKQGFLLKNTCAACLGLFSVSAGKPQKLLIVINPIGGKGTARQVFEKRLQPMFALAGVELVVKGT